MDVLSVQAFPGPNRWFHVPVVEALVDTRDWSCSQGCRNALDKVAEQLPGFRASYDAEPAGLLKELIRALQAAAGVQADYAEVRRTDQGDVNRVIIGFEEEALVRECLRLAVQMLLLARNAQEPDAAAEVRKLHDLADNVRLGPSSRAIVRAACARGIPFRRLNAGSLVQLGEGKHQRRTWTAETDATSAVAESIASDKELTKRLLRAMGCPVPRGRPVESADDAWVAAQEIGLPVAIKPRRANHARGISLDLTTHEQFAPAYDFAVEDGDHSGVMVEQFAPGHAHRLLVVGERMVAAARGESEHVTGDGVRTIRELVDEVNRDPRRGENYSDVLNVLKLDAGALLELKKQGLTPESVPAADHHVLVHPVGDLTTDVTHLVHPKNAAHAVLAAKAVGLDIAGIDLVAEDIGRPLEEQRGMILEVNAGPSLSMHIAPLHGEPQPVGEAIVDLLFGPGNTGRVPIVAVTGPGDRGPMVEQIERTWQAANVVVGAATREGVRVAGRPVACDATTDAQRVRTLLMHPEVEAVVFESQPQEAASHGLGCARCDLVIVVPCVNARDEDLDQQIIDGIVAAARAVPASGSLLIGSGAPCNQAAEACRGEILEFAPDQVLTVAEAMLAGVQVSQF